MVSRRFKLQGVEMKGGNRETLGGHRLGTEKGGSGVIVKW